MKSTMGLKAYRFDALLWVCNYLVAVFPSVRLRHLFYRWAMQIRVDDGARIFSGAWLDCRGQMTVGKNSVINQRCRLDNRGGISIGENVSISPEVHLITADHDVNDPMFGGRNKPIVICDRVFVGSRATILPGVTLHRGCVVAAGSVVTKDVPEYAVVAGVPARQISSRSRELRYELNYVRHFL